MLTESLFWDESENQLSEDPQVSRPAYSLVFENQAGLSVSELAKPSSGWSVDVDSVCKCEECSGTQSAQKLATAASSFRVFTA